MTLNDISKQHIIIVTLQREYPVLICRHRDTAEYVFFQKNGEDCYSDVDKTTYKELKKLFPSTLPDEFFTNESQSFHQYECSDISKEKVEEKLNFAKPIINEIIDNILKITNQKTMQRCKSNLETADTKIMLDDPNVKLMLYNVINHDIRIGKINKNDYIFLYQYLHEKLHATSKSENSLSLGYMKSYLNSLNGKAYSISVGKGLNETMTDFLAVYLLKQYINANNINSEQAKAFMNNPVYSGYDIMVNAMYNVFTKTDLFTCINYYFDGDLDGLVNYLKEEFHYDNADNILSFIYKLDVYEAMLNQTEIEFNDNVVIVKEMYKDMFDLIFHKYRAEGKDLSSLTFEQTYSPLRLPKHLNNQDFINALKNIFENSKHSDTIKNHELNNDFFTKIIFVSGLAEHKQMELNSTLLEPEFMLLIYSKYLSIIDFQDKKLDNNIKEKAFEFMFSNEYHGFINHEKEKLNIISHLVSHSKLIEFDFVKYISPKDLANALKTKPRLFDDLSNNNPFVFLQTIKHLDNKTLKNPFTILGLINITSKHPKQDFIFIDYYLSCFKDEVLNYNDLLDIIDDSLKYFNNLENQSPFKDDFDDTQITQ